MANKTTKKSGGAKVHTSVRITPLGDRVLVKPITEKMEKTASGIIIPDTVDKERPETGTVISVGPGRLVDGKRQAIGLSAGDTVVFSKYGYDEVKLGDEEYYLIKEDNILAIIK